MVLAEARPTVRRERSSERTSASLASANLRCARRRAATQPRRPETVVGVRVTRTAPAKKANFGRLTFVAVVVTGLLLGNLGLRARVIKCGYTLSRLEEALAATQTEYDRLSLAIANLQSLERVEEAARARLGMVDPTSAEFVVLAPGGPGQAAAAGTGNEPSSAPSRLERGFATRTGNVLIGLVSPFVARWFYDVPDQDHPRVRVAAR